MASEFTMSLEDTIALTVYDGIKKKGIPDMKKGLENAIASVSYEYAGKQLSGMLINKFFPNNMKEATMAGKIVVMPIGLFLGRKLTGGSGNYKEDFIKSLVSIGALSVYKSL